MIALINRKPETIDKQKEIKQRKVKGHCVFFLSLLNSNGNLNGVLEGRDGQLVGGFHIKTQGYCQANSKSFISLIR